MLLTILKKRQRLASARLCSRVRHPKVSIISETLALESKLQVVQRTARRWTFSIWLILSLWWGSIFQLRPDQGSKATSLTPDIFVRIFLFTKPRDLWAVPVILSMCEPLDKLLEMSTPRYLAQVTVSRISPCRL